MGLFGGKSEAEKQGDSELQEKISKVKITTGDIKQNYEILKIFLINNF
jgi:hypothetical protein